MFIVIIVFKMVIYFLLCMFRERERSVGENVWEKEREGEDERKEIFIYFYVL